MCHLARLAFLAVCTLAFSIEAKPANARTTVVFIAGNSNDIPIPQRFLLKSESDSTGQENLASSDASLHAIDYVLVSNIEFPYFVEIQDFSSPTAPGWMRSKAAVLLKLQDTRGMLELNADGVLPFYFSRVETAFKRHSDRRIFREIREIGAITTKLARTIQNKGNRRALLKERAKFHQAVRSIRARTRDAKHSVFKEPIDHLLDDLQKVFQNLERNRPALAGIPRRTVKFRYIEQGESTTGFTSSSMAGGTALWTVSGSNGTLILSPYDLYDLTADGTLILGNSASLGVSGSSFTFDDTAGFASDSSLGLLSFGLETPDGLLRVIGEEENATDSPPENSPEDKPLP